MGETIRIDRGARPWQPTADTTLVEELNHYDMPLSGILDQDGRRILFRCLAGQLESAHLWAYRLLATGELGSIQDAQTPDELRVVLDGLLSDGPVVVAVASDDDGILGTTEVPAISDSALRGAVDLIVYEFDQHLDERRQRAAEIRDVLSRSVA